MGYSLQWADSATVCNADIFHKAGWMQQKYPFAFGGHHILPYKLDMNQKSL